MELFLIKLVAFFRPLASIQYLEPVFEAAGVALFGALVVGFLIRSAVRKDAVFNATDLAILAFTAWCIAIYLVYFEEARLRQLAKLLIPLLSYIVVRHAISSREQYCGMLRWAVAGFSIPLFASAALIVTGAGIDIVNYWTGLPRWRGAYLGSHSLGHSMTLLIMTLVIYNVLSSREEGKHSRVRLIVTGVIGAVALFCLYKSQVRSAILGLLVFAGIYVYFASKRMFLLGAAGLAVLALVTLPHWLPALAPGVIAMKKGVSDISDIGSGRLHYWQHNIEVFSELPLDRKLAGIGVGDIPQTMYVDETEALDSHNDWLDVLMQTGIVGLAIFVAVQFLVFRAILRLPVPGRFLFLALFSAVAVMMFVSNSYAWRIQVGHLYYMMLAYVELNRTHASTAIRGEAVRGKVVRGSLARE